MSRKRVKNIWMEKEAVSPVIGVILLVAITVVLASVLYLWVSSFVITSKSTPTGSATVAYPEGSPYVVVTVKEISPESKPADMITYQILTSEGVVKTIGGTYISGKLSDIYNVDLTGESEYISFSDNDVPPNGKLSPNDKIQIKSSIVSSGDVLSIRYYKTGGVIFENSLTG
jgi:flagellin-like protein